MLTEVTLKGQVHYGEILLQHNAHRGYNQDRK